MDPLTVVAELLITIGVISVLFVAYQVWWTNIEAEQRQSEANHRLGELWNDENPRALAAPAEGTAFARLAIPAFGSDYSFAIVEGVSDADLEIGPGHYPQSAAPGEAGNFAVAGHRVGRGAPFNDLNLLNSCDAIVVETAGSWNIYRVLPIDVQGQQRQQAVSSCFGPELAARLSQGGYATVPGREVTTPGDVSVIAPIPGTPSAQVAAPGAPDAPRAPGVEVADVGLLTLTTCHPQFSNQERMIVHAALQRVEPKVPGVVPVEMQEGR